MRCASETLPAHVASTGGASEKLASGTEMTPLPPAPPVPKEPPVPVDFPLEPVELCPVVLDEPPEPDAGWPFVGDDESEQAAMHAMADKKEMQSRRSTMGATLVKPSRLLSGEAAVDERGRRRTFAMDVQ